MDIGTQAKKGPGATLIFDAPIDDVWPMFGDLSQIANYNPGIKTVDILSAEGVNKKEGVGSVRRCNFNDGNSIVEVRQASVHCVSGFTIRFTYQVDIVRRYTLHPCHS